MNFGSDQDLPRKTQLKNHSLRDEMRFGPGR